jgi:hypothetical protein
MYEARFYQTAVKYTVYRKMRHLMPIAIPPYGGEIQHRFARYR